VPRAILPVDAGQDLGDSGLAPYHRSHRLLARCYIKMNTKAKWFAAQ